MTLQVENSMRSLMCQSICRCTKMLHKIARRLCVQVHFMCKTFRVLFPEYLIIHTRMLPDLQKSEAVLHQPFHRRVLNLHIHFELEIFSM